MNNGFFPYPTRWFKKMIMQSLPFLCFFILLSILDKQKVPQQPLSGNSLSQKNNGLPVGGTSSSSSSNENVIIHHLVKEEIERGLVLVEHHPTHIDRAKIVPVSRRHQPLTPQYFNSSLPETVTIHKGEDPSWKLWGDRLEAVKDYFRYLQIPQTNCRKLKRMGGTISCPKNGSGKNMDGHKYVCMDPALMLTGAKSTESNGCLTLSFGTEFDTSFDDAMADLPCQVHMFDVLDYNSILPHQASNVHFHLEGLAGSKRTNFFKNLNKSVEMETLRGHVIKNNWSARLIHVLKVDIENNEWESFRDITKDPIFDAVGQLAMEVHAVDVVKDLKQVWSKKLSQEKWLQAIQDRYDVLRAIEDRGFRRVVYWDNILEEYPYFDEDGNRYEASGELLYVNTNWYKDSFKNQLSSRGYKFLDVT